MDYRKTNAPTTTVTRDMMELCEDTGNVYESVAIIGKRANQISVEIKNDLSKKLAEFASYNDNLEEVFENREQNPVGCGNLHACRTVHRSGRSDSACFQTSGSGFGRRRISVYLGLVRDIVAQCTCCLLYDIPFP